MQTSKRPQYARKFNLYYLKTPYTHNTCSAQRPRGRVEQQTGTRRASRRHVLTHPGILEAKDTGLVDDPSSEILLVHLYSAMYKTNQFYTGCLWSHRWYLRRMAGDPSQISKIVQCTSGCQQPATLWHRTNLSRDQLPPQLYQLFLYLFLVCLLLLSRFLVSL